MPSSGTRSGNSASDLQGRYQPALPDLVICAGDEYKLWGLIPGNIHLFGVRTEPDTFVPLFLLGSDTLGHDMLSRIFFGARISLTVGLLLGFSSPSL